MMPSVKEISAARAQCPGAIVLFRTGDFYWTKGVDAAWLTDVCDLPPDRDTCTFSADQLETVLKQLVADAADGFGGSSARDVATLRLAAAE